MLPIAKKKAMMNAIVRIVHLKPIDGIPYRTGVEDWHVGSEAYEK